MPELCTSRRRQPSQDASVNDTFWFAVMFGADTVQLGVVVSVMNYVQDSTLPSRPVLSAKNCVPEIGNQGRNNTLIRNKSTHRRSSRPD